MSKQKILVEFLIDSSSSNIDKNLFDSYNDLALFVNGMYFALGDGTEITIDKAIVRAIHPQ